MSDSPPVSRRTFLSAGATVLATFGVSAALPGGRALADPVSPAPPNTDLALYRPVAASSTDYAPTPPSFAVDGLSQVGVKESGWRAAQGDPQWISVDLQAPCRIEAVTLVFEADPGDPPFDGNYEHRRRRDPVQRRSPDGDGDQSRYRRDRARSPVGAGRLRCAGVADQVRRQLFLAPAGREPPDRRLLAVPRSALPAGPDHGRGLQRTTGLRLATRTSSGPRSPSPGAAQTQRRAGRGRTAPQGADNWATRRRKCRTPSLG